MTQDQYDLTIGQVLVASLGCLLPGIPLIACIALVVVAHEFWALPGILGYGAMIVGVWRELFKRALP